MGRTHVSVFDALGRVYQISAPVSFVNGVLQRHGSRDGSSGVSAGKQGDGAGRAVHRESPALRDGRSARRDRFDCAAALLDVGHDDRDRFGVQKLIEEVRAVA